MKEYAVYKGDELLVLGTKQECAARLGVKPAYIYWMTTAAAQRRRVSRKDEDNAMIAIVIEDDEEAAE